MTAKRIRSIYFLAYFSMNNDTPKTNKKAEWILAEFGPNNGGRFAAMADYARDQEQQLAAIARLTKSLSDSPKSLQSHMERWADDFLANAMMCREGRAVGHHTPKT